jgi:hypothetical protein
MSFQTHLHRPKPGVKVWSYTDKQFAMSELRAGKGAEHVCATLNVKRNQLDNMLKSLLTSVSDIQKNRV